MLRVVDYRDLVHTLVREPQAFCHSVFREDPLPAHGLPSCLGGVLDERLEPRKACRVYFGLLHLAALHACEAQLTGYLDRTLDAGAIPDLDEARAAVAPIVDSNPVVTIIPPDLRAYDSLLPVLTTPETP